MILFKTNNERLFNLLFRKANINIKKIFQKPCVCEI